MRESLLNSKAPWRANDFLPDSVLNLGITKFNSFPRVFFWWCILLKIFSNADGERPVNAFKSVNQVSLSLDGYPIIFNLISIYNLWARSWTSCSFFSTLPLISEETATHKYWLNHSFVNSFSEMFKHTVDNNFTLVDPFL